MAEAERVIEILKNEYGISTEKDLNKAIAELGFLNLSPFLSSVPPSKQKKRRIKYEAIQGTV